MFQESFKEIKTKYLISAKLVWSSEIRECEIKKQGIFSGKFVKIQNSPSENLKKIVRSF